ncbi:MAG: right-handed parallel beta-helix repeat-containing protein [Phycisphaerales bacterium]|nr:right-handed parallel beta-helix repeat-containing protein [Phycisphaerales bacterium]
MDNLLNRRLLLGGLAGAAGVTALSSVGRAAGGGGGAGGGPLNPPAGPVAPTSRPLIEIEPRTIVSQATTPGDATAIYVIRAPGSYFLGGPIAGVAGRSAIKIIASNVTLDLRGFGVFGVAAALDGIVIEPSSGTTVRNVYVHDGSVAGWPRHGVMGLSTSLEGVRLDRLNVSGCGEYGALLTSVCAVVDCSFIGNGASGLSVQDACVVVRCLASENGSTGIDLNSQSSVESCTSSNNGGSGFSFAADGRFVNCLATGCDGAGFTTFFSPGSVLELCTAVGCGTYGFDLNVFNLLRGCTARACNTAGFYVRRHSRLIDCISYFNPRGIEVIDGCLLSGCVCNENGGTAGEGILLNGTDNRVEGCHMTGNATGLRATSGGNFIAGNTASGSAVVNWNLVANNKCLVVAGVNAGAINGSSGGVSPGSTDPNANYSF